MNNNLTEMRAMLHFLRPGSLTDPHIWRLEIEKKCELGRQRLGTILSCLMIRRTKDQKTLAGIKLLDLPEKKWLHHSVTQTPEEKEGYSMLREEGRQAYFETKEGLYCLT